MLLSMNEVRGWLIIMSLALHRKRRLMKNIRITREELRLIRESIIVANLDPFESPFLSSLLLLLEDENENERDNSLIIVEGGRTNV